jgi:hypothetical protein
MKKLGLYLLTLLALGFASCDDSSDLGIAQENAQEAIMSADGVTVKYGSAISGSALNLNDYEGKVIPVIELVSATDLPEGSTVSYEMQVSPTQDFANYKTLQVTDGAVLQSDWQNAYVELIGKAPYAETNWVRFAVYADVDTQKFRIGGIDTWFATKQLTVTPVPVPVESAYYLGGTLGKVAFNHSSAAVWDDTTFKLSFTVTDDQAAAGFTWNIVSESGKVYGVSETGDATDASGNLVLNGANGVIRQAGPYMISVDMVALTYTVTKAYNELYTPGDSNGWGFGNNMLLTTTDYKNYWGYVYVKSEFKLAANASWDVNWGISSTEAGKLVADGGNIKVSEPGLYYVTANLDNETYTITHITSIGLIGDFNGWGSQENLTPSEDYKTWTGTVTVNENGWKFRANDDWGINLGGTADNLVPNGENIMTAAGTYTVTLNLGSIPYTYTLQ